MTRQLGLVDVVRQQESCIGEDRDDWLIFRLDDGSVRNGTHGFIDALSEAVTGRRREAQHHGPVDLSSKDPRKYQPFAKSIRLRLDLCLALSCPP